MKQYPRSGSKGVKTAVAALLFAVVATACHKELVIWPAYLNTNFNVVFDWTGIKEANPSVMQFIAFSEEGGDPLEFGFANAAGGTAKLHYGDYRAVAHNDDSETFYGTGSSWKDYEIFGQTTTLDLYSPMFIASRAVPRGEGAEDEPFVEEPDRLWVSATTTAFRAGTNEDETLTMPMKPATYTYNFTITNVANLEYVTDIMATVSGMSQSMTPFNLMPSHRHCTIPVKVTVVGENTITITVRSFGHCPGHEGEGTIISAEPEARHNLVVYARLTDGSKWYYEYDITEPLHDPDVLPKPSDPDDPYAPYDPSKPDDPYDPSKPDNPDNPDGPQYDIGLDDLPFPRPISDDSGVHPEVEEWNEVHQDIDM